MTTTPSSSPYPTSPPAQRVGHGFDLHRLEAGLPLILGGVRLQHDRGCAAHSDGDAVYHTVTDAILGALALPDIGQLFPDSDPQWRGATSDRFLRAACEHMRQHGYRVSNLDVTVILEKPKLSPHKEQMRQNLALLLGIEPCLVNVKAKTHEKVDSLGENRSVACHAVVLLERQMTSGGGASSDEARSAVSPQAPAAAMSCGLLEPLYATIVDRKSADASTSWTARLFAKGRHKIAQKVGEEATEVVIDAVRDCREEVIHESADLLYHLLVLWADMHIQPADVFAELQRRRGQSGIAEKQKRSAE